MAKILLVDDEKNIVVLMKFILERSGHTVATAFNGQEAVQALGVDPPDAAADLPDLVILDVMMPIMDGCTAATAIRNNARTANLPILVITAKDDTRQFFEAIPSVVGFFPKPFDPKNLREVIAQVVPGK